MCMNESTRINEDMSSYSASPYIFFKSKSEYSIFCKHLPIWECVSSNNSNRWIINIKSIKCVFESMFWEWLVLKHEDFSCFKSVISEEISSIFRRNNKLRRSFMRKSRERVEWESNTIWTNTCRKHRISSTICYWEFKISNSTSHDSWNKKLKKSAFFKKWCIFNSIAKSWDYISCSINRWKFKGWKNLFKQFNIHSFVCENPSMETILFWENYAHIRKSRIYFSSTDNCSESSSYKYCGCIWTKECEWILLSGWREDYSTHQIHIIFIWQEWRFHSIDKTCQCWCISETRWFNLSTLVWSTSIIVLCCSSRRNTSRAMFAHRISSRWWDWWFFVVRYRRFWWSWSSTKWYIITVTKNMVHKKISEKYISNSRKKDTRKRNIQEINEYLGITEKKVWKSLKKNI